MRSIILIFAITIALAFACGQDDSESSSGGGTASAPAAKSSSGSGSGSTSGGSTASVEEISALGKQCVDLVKAKRYADAIDPCERAVKEGTTKEIDQAYAEAKEAVKAEATKAAAAAATDAAAGELTKDSAKQQGLNALGNLGGGSD